MTKYFYYFLFHPLSYAKKAALRLLFAEGEGFLLWQATASITWTEPSDYVGYKPWGFHPLSYAKKAALRLLFAEGEGFKPPIPEKGIPDFESSAIDHSANLPRKRGCKDKHFLLNTKFT